MPRHSRAPVLITTDLDRTLIFSPRATAELGGALLADPVECSGGRTAGELSHAARDALAGLPAHAVLCVATSRSVARLTRLSLPFPARYAIAANGGVVLDGGEPEPRWAARTARLLADAAPAARVRTVVAGLAAAADRRRGGSWLQRMGDEDDLCCLAIIDLARFGADDVETVRTRCAGLGWQASLTGRKLYAFPAGFGKEHAAAYVAGLVAAQAGADPVRLAAGDTEHDRAMLASADRGWVPAGSELAARVPAADLPAVTVTRLPGHAAAAQITAEWLEICLGW